MKKLSFVALLLVGMSACNSPKNEAQKMQTTSTGNQVTTPEPVPEPVQNWEYLENKDEMTGQPHFFARTNSTNTLDFEFPYDGGSTLTILVRKTSGASEVILSISKGQFIGSYNNETVEFKFDDGDVERYGFEEAGNGSSDVIFLNSSKKLIEKFKKAKTVKVRPVFFQSSRQVANFNLEGFKWEH